MITAEYAVTCDGCGLAGPSSGKSRCDAQFRAQADGWTADDTIPLARQHWCPACTTARKEQAGDHA